MLLTTERRTVNLKAKFKQGQLQTSTRLILVSLGLTLLLTACAIPGQELTGAERLPAGDPVRGWQAIQDYGCHSCHAVPGVPGTNSYVGPPLTAWADRHYIAGKLPNEPDSLVQWIRFPQAIEPGTAMPNMGVTEGDAQDIAAYLYTLQDDEGWMVAFYRYWRTNAP
jgi:cytochrome c